MNAYVQKLSDWRDDDHEDALVLNRNEICNIVDSFKSQDQKIRAMSALANQLSWNSKTRDIANNIQSILMERN